SLTSADARLLGDLNRNAFPTLGRRVTGLPRMCLREITQVWRHGRLRPQGIGLDWTKILIGPREISLGGLILRRRSVIRTSLLWPRRVGDRARRVLDQVTVLTADHDLDDAEFRTVARRVGIEPYVLIFRKTIVLPGTRIGFVP